MIKELSRTAADTLSAKTIHSVEGRTPERSASLYGKGTRAKCRVIPYEPPCLRCHDGIVNLAVINTFVHVDVSQEVEKTSPSLACGVYLLGLRLALHAACDVIA